MLKIEISSKMQTKAPEDVELTGLSSCYFGFSKKSFVDSLKNEKLKFLHNFLQNPKFLKFSKNRTICGIIIPGHIACQISG